MNREDKIKQVQVISSGIEAVQRACPLIEAPKIIISGLSELLQTQSPAINPNHQRQLKGILRTNTLNYFYVSINNGFKIPKELRFVYYKNELNKNDPNTIKPLDIKGFKFYGFCIQMLNHDSNGFYFIIHKKDIVSFLLMIRKANELSKYQKESIEFDFEKIEDECTAKHSYEYEKIFELEEYTRKQLFYYMKEAGLTKENRKLLKQCAKPCKSFEVIVEELEEKIELLKRTPRPLTYMEDLRVYEELKETELELLRLTEEDNSWNNLKTDIEDYFYL